MRYFVILILAVAAAVQGWDLLMSLPVSAGNILPYGKMILLILLEAGFVVALAVGRPGRRVWLAVVLLFAAFTLVSLYNELTGQKDCGCFGKTAISPRFAFLFDSIVFLLLLFACPKSKYSSSGSPLQ